ncbi:hypothetical protein ONZ45_g3062 [Pleurotus djamor]|nr:hypothetical protein ONZ45_g3062 [Pleurotus djamor]
MTTSSTTTKSLELIAAKYEYAPSNTPRKTFKPTDKATKRFPSADAASKSPRKRSGSSSSDGLTVNVDGRSAASSGSDKLGVFVSRSTPNRSVRSSPSKKARLDGGKQRNDQQTGVGDGRGRGKAKRGYAPPEAYKHLNPLTDCLKPDLDVVFCGINPGRVSAERGHHFANPNNHFYKALHLSGFTPNRIPPEEDATLPDRFNIGLTDLVERPTSDVRKLPPLIHHFLSSFAEKSFSELSHLETELSQSEKVASVPTLLAKIVRFRPKIVAFVGLGIARVVEVEVHKMNGRSGGPAKGLKVKREPGLQSFKLVYPSSQADGDPAHPNDVSETLFYAMPSSSGAVSQYQLADKIAIMEDLKRTLEQIKNGSLDTRHCVSVAARKIPGLDAMLGAGH